MEISSCGEVAYLLLTQHNNSLDRSANERAFHARPARYHGSSRSVNSGVGPRLKRIMKQFTDSVRNAIAQRNWYACSGLALALPDICGFLESPNDGSQRRYVAWCNQFLTPSYTRVIGPSRTRRVFLSGEDCYALRCAFLHEGSDDVVRQRARRALESFVFVEPPAKGMIHCNQSNTKLQLQVDIFCEDICAGVDQWVKTVLVVRPDIQARITELMSIKSLEDGLQF